MATPIPLICPAPWVVLALAAIKLATVVVEQKKKKK